MTPRQEKVFEAVKMLMASPQYVPTIKDEDVVEDPHGSIRRMGKDSYAGVDSNRMPKTRYSVADPNKLFVRDANSLITEIENVEA